MPQCLELYVFLVFFFSLVLNILSYSNLWYRNQNCVEKSTLKKHGTTSGIVAKWCPLDLSEFSENFPSQGKFHLKIFYLRESTNPISLAHLLDFNLVEILKKFLGCTLMRFMSTWRTSTTLRSCDIRGPRSMWSGSAAVFYIPTLALGQATAVADISTVAINQ